MTVQEIQTMIRQNMVLYRNVAKPLTDKEADLLIATWADALSDVPSAAGKLAFRRALRVCHFPVLIADLYDQLRAMQMTEHQKKVQQAIDLMMQIDVIDTEIFIEAVKSGYFKQDHTETELRAYIENARQQRKA